MVNAPIIMADDDFDDRILVEHAIRKIGLKNPLQFVKDGEELLQRLCNEGEFENTVTHPRPGLVLLDINMPRMNGKQALKKIRQFPQFANLPIVILSTSKESEEFAECYALGANKCISKPLDFNLYIEKLNEVSKFLLQGKKVLLVDDDEDEFFILNKLLAQSGRKRFELDWVPSIEQAKIKFNDDTYDAFLIDYNLADGNGVDLIRYAKELGCDKPFILLTGMPCEELSDDAIYYGADDLIPKNELSSMLIDRALWHAIERHHIKSKLSHLAMNDELTCIANRQCFLTQLVKTLSRCQRNDSDMLVMFMDLDGFKQINDNHGHDAGDKVLSVVAERLELIIRTEDVAARLGGDEFAIMMENIAAFDDIEIVANKIISSISEPIHIGAKAVCISCSIGISVNDGDHCSADGMLKQADLALYEVKNAGKHGFALYKKP